MTALPIAKKSPSLRYSLVCSLYLCLTIFLVWAWTKSTFLGAYSLPLTGLIILLYFLKRTYWGKKPTNLSNQLTFDIAVLTATLLLIITASGDLNSSFFFLIYFLLFAFALIFDISTTLILTIAIALYFGDSLTSSRAAIQLSSLVLFSPMAIYFGKQYNKLLVAQLQIKLLDKANLTMSKDITTEENLTLPWLTLNFKDTMIKVISLTSEMLSDIGTLKPRHKEKLKELLEDSKELLASGNELKKEIDRVTD